MLRVEELPLHVGARIWTPLLPSRAQARLWGISFECGNTGGAAETVWLQLRLAGKLIWTVSWSVPASDSLFVHVSLSGQGSNVTGVGEGVLSQQIIVAPRTPWLPPDIAAQLRWQGGANTSLSALVVWEDLPWSSPLPRRMSPEMGTRQERG